MKLKQFIQQETVLTAAAVLAVVSAFFVPPDAQYLGYIDLRTLAILFSLMTVMAGLRRQGFFDGLGRALLSRTHSTFQLTLVLVGLCFFGSMFITNDVSLLTFVPFTFVVLSRLGADVRRALLIPVVCMQTIGVYEALYETYPDRLIRQPTQKSRFLFGGGISVFMQYNRTDVR